MGVEPTLPRQILDLQSSTLPFRHHNSVLLVDQVGIEPTLTRIKSPPLGTNSATGLSFVWEITKTSTKLARLEGLEPSLIQLRCYGLEVRSDTGA